MMEEAGTCVGLVINLTFTERYYCKSEWEASGITYQKIPCPGHTVNTPLPPLHFPSEDSALPFADR